MQSKKKERNINIKGKEDAVRAIKQRKNVMSWHFPFLFSITKSKALPQKLHEIDFEHEH